MQIKLRATPFTFVHRERIERKRKPVLRFVTVGLISLSDDKYRMADAG